MIDMNKLCARQVTLAIIENNGKTWIGQNKCDTPQKKCPREGMKTSEGYELCKSICGQRYHAEVDACLQAGTEAGGGDLYLIGHYYYCNLCGETMKQYGIKNIHILSGKLRGTT